MTVAKDMDIKRTADVLRIKAGTLNLHTYEMYIYMLYLVLTLNCNMFLTIAQHLLGTVWHLYGRYFMPLRIHMWLK